MVKSRRNERETGSAFERLSPSFVSALFRARGRDVDSTNDNNNGGSAQTLGKLNENFACQSDEAAHAVAEDPAGAARDLTWSFLRLAHVDNGAFDRLSRYEAVIWRQIVQTLFVLGTMRRRHGTVLARHSLDRAAE
jgi:hypothetical protein